MKTFLFNPATCWSEAAIDPCLPVGDSGRRTDLARPPAELSAPVPAPVGRLYHRTCASATQLGCRWATGNRVGMEAPDELWPPGEKLMGTAAATVAGIDTMPVTTD